MPGMSGLELLEILKNGVATQRIPVIVVTAKSEERYKALEMGAEDFLAKPIDVIELKFRVGNLLKLKRFNDLQQFFNQRLKEEIRKKEQQLTRLARMGQELSLASEIQKSLIPKTFPAFSDLLTYGVCTQALEVGGDYFDIFNSECGRYTLFIMADVSGHGFASALIAMQFRTLVRAELIEDHPSLAERVELINTIFSHENGESSMFITALFLRYDHQTGMMESVNAGHFDPYGSPSMLHESTIPLGIQPDMPYTALLTPFPPDSLIILYTDGIIEGTDAYGEMYGKRFYTCVDAAGTRTPKELGHHLMHGFYEFVESQEDDVTLLIIQAKPMACVP